MIRKYTTILLYIIAFFIIAITLVYIYEKVFQVFLCSFVISIFSRELNIFKRYRRLLLLCYLVCYLTFFSFSIFLNKDWISVFAFTYFILDYPIFNFFNNISLKNNNREISIIGGPGFNIKSHNSVIDILYGLIGLILIIGYSIIIARCG